MHLIIFENKIQLLKTNISAMSSALNVSKSLEVQVAADTRLSEIKLVGESLQ
jgi:hypothetical protein